MVENEEIRGGENEHSRSIENEENTGGENEESRGSENNDKCYSILGSVNAYTWMKKIKWEVLCQVEPQKKRTFSADMKEQCWIAASKGNHILGLIRKTST